MGNKEYALFKNLFQNYSQTIRPVKTWSDQLNVNMSINLFKVANLVNWNLCYSVKLNLKNNKKITLFKKIENDQTMTIYASIEMVKLKISYLFILIILKTIIQIF